jgi:hypothetical protein
MRNFAHYNEKSQTPTLNFTKRLKTLFSHKFYISVILMEKLHPARLLASSKVVGWTDDFLYAVRRQFNNTMPVGQRIYFF